MSAVAEADLDAKEPAGRAILKSKTLLNPLFVTALMLYPLLVGFSLSGRAATMSLLHPYAVEVAAPAAPYGAPPPPPPTSPNRWVTGDHFGIAITAISFISVGVVHLELVLHLTMYKGLRVFPRLNRCFSLFMPTGLHLTTTVYFLQYLHTSRYGVWWGEWITFICVSVILGVIHMALLAFPVKMTALLRLEEKTGRQHT